jgi:hypothetical protein
VRSSPALELLGQATAAKDLQLVGDRATDLVARLPTQYAYFEHLDGLRPEQPAVAVR